MVLGLLVVWAVVLDPTAGAKLPPAPPFETTIPTAPPAKSLFVRSGDTLIGVLQRAGIGIAPAQAAIDALKRSFDPRALKAGQEIALRRDGDTIDELRLSPDLQRDIVLKRNPDGGYAVATNPRNLLHVPVRVAGNINSSLFEIASNAGVPQTVLAELIRVFSYDVDFQREIQPGDSFEIMYEQLIENESGKLAGAGDLVYAALTLSGHEMKLYRFAPLGGTADFYSPAGASNKKALLRTPVDGARISSTFGMRHHPILGYTAMHKGVDFAVPKGTPIMASGDATVVNAGRNGSYGNMVVLRHEGGYSTAYAHMSRVAKGMKPGVRVHQGDVIGYVGATGRATGPHLHYEVRLNDHAINPASVRMPATQKLQPSDFAAFQEKEATIDRQVASLRSSTFAAN
jgi:murein DD-endopeptidase MepM/ murein hydrolase activator NlpD